MKIRWLSILMLTGLILTQSLGCEGPSDSKSQKKADTKPTKDEKPVADVKPTPTKEADVKTTESGLKYVDLMEGTGAAAKAGDKVEVHYTGWLKDDTKFDSSLDHGQPFSFPLGAGRVIKGWDEGVAGMKVGGKRKLMIPANLAYRQEGRPPKIPPGADLIFEVELLKIN